ncbi:LTA synthase family protein [Thiorhodococcus mannitoliphagus]|uniref:LTA synthase family protein n=1 Tax=Thiorhodococcus mannitoliphagus TaxID=329406 RepID=A0A6P1DXK0_9GAMM|nr:LTA synthase family protein [Thiorhodococcus mannitoliphagus]
MDSVPDRVKLPKVSHPLLRGALSWIAALLFVVIWYFAAQMAIDGFFQVKPEDASYGRDLAAHLIIGAILFGIARSLPPFMLAASVLFSALTASNAAKLAILGAPVMPDDFAAARNMLLLLDGWLLLGAVLLVAVPIFLLGWMIAWKHPRAWVGLGLAGVAVSLLVSYPGLVAAELDKRFGNSVWNQPQNYQKRGLPIHLLQETARNLSRRVAPPTEEEVLDALTALNPPSQAGLLKVATKTQPSRNVHLILLESFWDPLLLEASRLSADPIAPAFRQLWAATEQSHLLSPVFGGYTANTEFEVLCGFPVTANNVYFETGLRRDAPCLPQHLVEVGYHSIASHPNAASFWNRVNAYRRIGFETYLADKDFQMDDMNRSFLSDASLYRQILERIGPELSAGRPMLNYVLTYFGHLPYPLNAKRPAVIEAAEGHEVVAAYANTIYYKSRELMAFLERLRETDPDALIVLFGDHLPALTPNFGGYTESGLLAKRRGELKDEMFRTLAETPLIVIDGKRGPVAVGDVPAYQLPALILDLLDDQRPTMLRLAQQAKGEASIRPLPGVHFTLDGDAIRVCRNEERDARACAESTQWIKAVETLRNDLFGGHQHSLREFEIPNDGFREASATPSDSAPERYF